MVVVAATLTAGAWCQENPAPAPPEARKEERKTEQRTGLNLVGVSDAAAGESRRNENLHFNPIDNNALKDLNVRLGTTATVVEVFQVERNYFGVEFGNRPSAPLHQVPSKVSALHGSLYAGHDSSIWRSRSFFQAGPVRPAHENDYGFNLGAPLWRGADFSLEGAAQKIRGSVNGNVLVPRGDERLPRTRDPLLGPIIERFLAAYPRELPNRTDVNERALNTNAPQRVDTSTAGGRLEQTRGARDRFRFHYLLTTQRIDAFQLIAGQNPDTTTRAHTARITWSRAWSAATVTDFSAGLDRLRSLLVPEPNSVGPSVSFGSVIESLGPESVVPIDRAQNLFRYAGHLRQSRRRHAWSAGFDLLRRQVNGSETSSHRGVLSFRNDFGRDAMTNFLLGIPSRFSGAIGNVHSGFRNLETHIYAGDDWHALPSLTLHYGLRFQPVTGPYEVDRLTIVPYGCDCNNLAPRLGFAWALPPGWGVVRAAYGLHYGEIFPVTFQQLRYNPPRNVKFELQAPSLIGLFDILKTTPDPNARSTVLELSPELSAPYSHQYNFSWQPAGGRLWAVQLAYVGSRSHRLLVRWRTNRALPVEGIPQTTATINQRRPDARYFDFRRVMNGSRGYFDAARASVVLTNWRGLGAEAAWWVSKAIDLGGNYTSSAAGEDGQQGRNQSESLFQQDLRGLSSFDQPHAFLLRLTYTAPRPAHGWRRLAGGWSFTGVLLAKSGTPFSVFSGSDAPGFGNVDGAIGDRPHVADPSVLGRTIGHPDTSAARLPAAAFAFMRPLEPRGNLGNNTFRKGPIRNLNAALWRVWKLGGDRSLTLRAESVNLSNTAQFAAPGAELTAPDFGQITNTLNDGRTFQFTLRLGF